jgi:hypothetical protein
VLTAAKALDFRVGERSIRGSELPTLPLPCFAFLESGEALKAALIVKTSDKEFLHFEAGSNEPQRAVGALLVTDSAASAKKSA